MEYNPTAAEYAAVLSALREAVWAEDAKEMRRIRYLFGNKSILHQSISDAMRRRRMDETRDAMVWITRREYELSDPNNQA